MFDFFFKLSIKTKLFLVIFASSLLASLFGFLVVLYVDSQNVHDEAVKYAQSEVNALSLDLVKILQSSDAAVSAEVVEKLHLFPAIFNVFLFDRNGLLVFQYERSPAFSMPPPKQLNESIEIENGVAGVILPVSYVGKRFGDVYMRLSIEEHGMGLQNTYRNLALLVPSIFLMSYLLAFWLYRYFSEPIVSLADRVRDIAEQRRFDEEITSEDANEIGALYRGVGQLLHAIRDAQQRLHQSEMRLEAVINIAGSALISIDEGHRITLFNRQAESVFGYAAREVLGRPIGMLLPEQYRESHTHHINEFSKNNIQKRMAQERSVVTGLRKNGEGFPIEASISQIMLGDKKMFTVALTDVTQRRQTELELEAYRLHLEEVVEGRTSELREKNNELEAFSYSVAHDLRAPLRSITSFSQILLNDAADKLSEDERDHLVRVVKAGRHMADLIDGILNLARIGRSQMSLTDVDLSVLVTQAKMRLLQNQEDREVVWDIQPGLVVRADQQLMGVVIDNLINNAWKYTGHQKQGHISFGVLSQRGKKIYFVRDNGAGFDMKHAQKLFAVFQRMHSVEEFEGTGVGLATVKRIIQRHGGTIWAEAAIEEGATFYFTIP